jgi:diguanylate cyclase (GGDEF)-like protein/PAS domain S-box-containing protein
VTVPPLHLKEADEVGQALIRASKVLKEAQWRVRATVESAPTAIVMIDEAGDIVLANVEMKRLFGFERDELINLKIEVLVPDRFRSKHPALRAGYFASPAPRSMGAGRDLYGRRKDGTEFPVEIGLSPVKIDQRLFVLAAIVDITERKLQIDELKKSNQALERSNAELLQAQHRAHHDALTGLANRALFNEIVDHQLAICGRTETSLAVLYIDLDGFKAVNDTHGHATGDELLCAVAARLKNGIRSSDLAARLGGDEFAIVLVSTGTEAAAAVAAKLADSVSMPYPIGQLTIEISASIGVAGYPDSGTSSEALLHSADETMYRAKAGRKQQIAPTLAS